MPSLEAHIRQAEKNERFYRTLTSSTQRLQEFTDWAVTGLFYSALHYMDAFLADRLGRHPKSHRERKFLLEKVPEINPIMINYLKLEDRSRDARYEIVMINSEYAKEIGDRQFQPIRGHIRQVLGLAQRDG